MARILVIDDEELARFTFREILEGEGHDVATASNGLEALAHLDRVAAPPDILLCDLSMPEMGGVDLLRHLAERNYEGAIVLVSGLDELTIEVAEGMARYRELNVAGKIHKPATPEAIVEVVGNLTKED